MAKGFTVKDEEVTQAEEALLERYAVFIEWDGAIPPTKWYRRLHAYGIRVRSKDQAEESIVESRIDAKRSTVIVQEGAIITFSYSLARMIAAWLMRGIKVEKYEFETGADGKRKIVNTTEEIIRPSLVLFGKVDIDKDFEPSMADVAALERVEKVRGARGRKAAPQDWAVTCYECMESFNAEETMPTNCPVCNGVHIDFTPGTVPMYRDDLSLGVYDFWVRSRLGTGGFEFPMIADNGADVPDLPATLRDDWAGDVAFSFAASPLLAQMDALGLSREQQFYFLDAAFTVRARWGDKRRMNARIEAITAFMVANNDPSALAEISMMEMPQPDLFDVAGKIGKDTAAGMMVAYMGRRAAGDDEDAAQAVEVPAVTVPSSNGNGVTIRKAIV